MDLILKHTRNIESVVYIKKYEYGDFKIRVDVNPDDTYFICAESKNGLFEITAAKNNGPVLSMFMLALTRDMMNSFISGIVQANELMEIIEKNREMLIKMEECDD